MSYLAEVHGTGDPPGRYTRNALRFRTRAEADRYGRDLYSRWTGMDGFRVRRSGDPVSHVADRYGRVTRLEGAARRRGPRRLGPKRAVRGVVRGATATRSFLLREHSRRRRRAGAR